METPTQSGQPQTANAPWARNLLYLWDRRRTLVRVGIVALLLSAAYAFLIPKRYESSTSLMPPDQQSGGAAMLAALAARSGGSSTGGLGMLASGLLGVKSNGELYMDLLHSGSVTGNLVDRFHLQQVYKTRYMKDTLKKLSARTQISENKKSGIITIVVSDTDRQRAQDLARAYVEQLNKLLSRVSTSSARREREFIEQRLVSVTRDLEEAQEDLSHFSSSTSTIDIREQTRATVDAGAKLQAELIVGESELGSLKQIYGDDNVRVRAANERIGVLQHELNKMGGTAPTASELQTEPAGELYPPLRRLPELGVRYADLYRRVKVQEAVFELLSAEHESARLQEAKEIPTVSVVDAAGYPEKKSFPPRLYFMLGGTFIALLVTSILMLLRRNWHALDENDDLKVVVRHLSAPRAAKEEARA
jgi:capsule polysaccharide export protein KpsE/RkpR